MPDFLYKAKTLTGVNVSGKLAANSRREALDVLARQSLFPSSVVDAKKGQININFGGRRISPTLIAATLSQLADLLENGVPVLTAFQTLVKQATQPGLKAVLNDLLDQVSEGESIDNAFASHPKVFNELTISIIRAGAEGAFLEDSLRRTARFLEQQGEMRAKIIGAMTYPLILCVVGFLLVTVLVTFFVPKFEPMFDQIVQQGGQLPAATVFLLKARTFIAAYWMYLGGGIAIVAVWVKMQATTKWGRRFLDRWKLKIPILGMILLESAVARFCRVFGTLLENGVPILRALDISSNSTGNVLLAEAITKSAENVSAGESLAKPLAETGIFPPQVMVMISVAEESNTLESVLIGAADTMERQISRRLETMLRLLEPLLLLGMALAVLFIILALLFPIFQMGANFQF